MIVDFTPQIQAIASVGAVCIGTLLVSATALFIYKFVMIGKKRKN